MHLKIMGITDSPKYYLGNELVRDGNRIHVSSKKYVNGIMRKYKKKHGEPKKEVHPMRVKEHPGLDDYPLFNEKEHNYFQKIIGVYQWIIVSDIFDLEYSVSSLSMILTSPRVDHISMFIRIFGYLKNHLKRGYAIISQPLNIDANYEKVHMKYYFGNQYAYSSEDIDEQFPEPLPDELDIYIFVYAKHGRDKVTGRSITGLFSVVVSTPTKISSKNQTTVKTSTFGAELTVLKNAVKESVMLRYHLISTSINVPKPTPVFVDSTSVVSKATNPGSTLNKKTVVLS